MRIDRRSLYTALHELARVADPRASIPILSHVLLRAENGILALTATDLTQTLTCKLPADGDLSTCVPAKLLAALVKPESKRDAGLVSLMLEGDRLVVETDSVTTRLPTADPADFPSGFGSSLEWSFVGTCDAAPLRDAITWVLPAASTDATRRHLCSVCLDNESATVAATDGHRLHTAPSPVSPIAPILLSADAADILHRILADGEQVIMARAKTGEREVLRVRFGPWQIETTLVDATFPPYQHVIPARDDQPTRFAVERIAFAKALRRVTAVAKNKQVQLCINGVLAISSADVDGGEASVIVTVTGNTHSGPDLITASTPTTSSTPRRAPATSSRWGSRRRWTPSAWMCPGGGARRSSCRAGSDPRPAFGLERCRGFSKKLLRHHLISRRRRRR